MNIDYGPELGAFRDEVRRFVEEEVPEALRIRTRAEHFSLGREDQLLFHRALYERGGWSCPAWPCEWGGPGWSYPQQYVFERELALAGAPRVNQYGSMMIGPAIMAFGTRAQQERFLPHILRADVLWCQGFSEPNAGSDLASLRCRAERDGDEYVINGAKVWTSDAHFSDWIFGLFRTDGSGKRQHGITLLLVDLASPGIEIRPIVKFEDVHEVNQVTFDEVRVPVDQRVGDEHQGWTVAKYILGNERFGTAEVSRTRASLDRLKRLAASVPEGGGGRLDAERDFAAKLAETEVALRALELTEMRFLFGPGGPDAMGAEASMLKIRGTELQQRVSELTVEALDHYAHPRVPEQAEPGYNGTLVGPWEAGCASRSYFSLRAASIYSGSNEIQRNIIAKAVLGL